MFYKWPDVPMSELPVERAQRAQAIAEGLAEAEIENILRRAIILRLPNLDDVLHCDVTQTGITFYMGGFDWITYPTPPQVLNKFPQFLPLPQQVFRDEPPS